MVTQPFVSRAQRRTPTAGLPSSQPRVAERGASTLVLAVSIVLVVVALIGAWQLSWLASGGRARAAADLVAIAAAEAQQRGTAACDVARRVAASNRADVLDCRVTTGWGEFVVDVTVAVDVVPRLPGAPTQAKADSRAGVVHELA